MGSEVGPQPMVTRILRWEVPVDDQVHEFDFTGDVLAVGCRDIRVVEFWALAYDRAPGSWNRARRMYVVGTGQPLPDKLMGHRGTVVAPGGQLVWHLIELER